jgi:hypothetical protein
MVQNCPTHLNKMTDDIRNGMTFAMSVWASDDLDWLQHGTCTGTCGDGPDGLPDLRMKNFVFTTEAGGNTPVTTTDTNTAGGSSNTGDSGNTGGSSNTGGNNNGSTVDLSGMAAGFAAIRNNPDY